MKDFHSRHLVARAIAPVSIADNTVLTSQIIDTRGYNSLEFAIAIGAIGTAGATFAVTMTHGDVADLSDGAAVPAAQLLGTLATASFAQADANSAKKIGYGANKRYVRLTITPAANASAALIGVTAILGSAHLNPVA